MKQAVDHIIFVVHGMGNQYNGHGKYRENLQQLDKTCVETMAEEFEEQKHIKWIPIGTLNLPEWHSKLHQLETVGERLKSTCLPTCSFLRYINNDILADVLFYFTSFHGQQLINIVTQCLNDTFNQFMEEHPDFIGKISIVAHSLGSIICYDILAHQENGIDNPAPPPFPQNQTHFPIVYPKLNFVPRFLFGLGSPLPAVLVMRGQSFQSYRLPPQIKYFNIFNLYDPMAYRIEPLIDKRYLEISPVLLQRPSSMKPFASFSYYKEMIAAYLPDIQLGNLKLPPFPNLSTSLFQFTLSGYVPQLPNIPVLSMAQEMLRSGMSGLYNTVVGKRRGHKRKLDEMDSNSTIRSATLVEPEVKQSPRRSIRNAVSKKSKTKATPSKEPTLTEKDTKKSKFMDTITNIVKSPESDTKLESNFNELGEQLTQELVEAAFLAQTEMNKESHERFDYFVQQDVMDNMIHQYMVGLRAHFSYWTDKDIMYHILYLKSMQMYSFCVFKEGKLVPKFLPKTPSPLTGYTGPKPVSKPKKREESIYREMVQRKWVLSDCYERYLADLDKKMEGFMNDIILEFENDDLDSSSVEIVPCKDLLTDKDLRTDTLKESGTIHAPTGELLCALTELLDQFLETQTESGEATVSVYKRKRNQDCVEPVQTPSESDGHRPKKKLRVKGLVVQS